jgi:hypothetical protein
MKAEIARALEPVIEECRKKHSSIRPHNPAGENHETFTEYGRHILSEHVAVIVWQKTPTLKIALSVFVWMPWKKWYTWDLTESHCHGFEHLSRLKRDIEDGNYPRNFQAYDPEQFEF